MNGNHAVPVKKEEDVEELSDNRKSIHQKLAATIGDYLPQPHVLDLRSIALFRILFGILQLCDIYERLSYGKYDLAWYTSDPPERSYIPPDTKYHRHFVLADFFLFQRGSAQDEVFFFLVYGTCLVFLTVGYQCERRWLLPLLYVLYNALLIKEKPGQFGSDSLCSQLLLWMCFLPLSQVWSVDAYLRNRRGLSQRDSKCSNKQVKSVACLGFTLQIIIMYVDCFCERTYEAFSWSELHKSDWFGPDYSLVHYCANGSGTYNTWITKIIRECGPLNKFMTFSGFWIETLVPPLLFLFNQRYSHFLAVLLILLHGGIGLILAIPHFYYLGMLLHVVWTPTHLWDRWLNNGKPLKTEYTYSRITALPAVKDEAAHHKKTDGDEMYETNGQDEKEHPSMLMIQEAKMARLATLIIQAVSMLMQCALLATLILTFIHAHVMSTNFTYWVTYAAYDNLHFDNEWGMWSPGAPRTSAHTVLLAWRKAADMDDIWEGDNFNLFEFIKSGNEVPFDDFTEEFLADSTYLYPSTRWEKALGDDWERFLNRKENANNDIAPSLGRAWCTFVNEDLAAMGRPPIDLVEIRTHRRRIGSPGSGKRYGKRKKDKRRWVYCDAINRNRASNVGM